jgi:hypothetical protein
MIGAEMAAVAKSASRMALRKFGAESVVMFFLIIGVGTSLDYFQ